MPDSASEASIKGTQKPMVEIPFSFLPSSVIRAICRWGPESLVSRLMAPDESLKTPGPVMVTRVDDFPRWDLDLTKFERFDSIMARYDIPYILGVIPQCEFYPGRPRLTTANELRYLRECLRDHRLALALHGFTHRPNNYRGLNSEIALYSAAELRTRIARAEEWFKEGDLPFPSIFIPPFNTITPENFEVLREHFKVVMTGSSALTTLGKFKPQRHGGILFLPSYGRLYGRSKQVRLALQSLKRTTLPVVVTLHWAWEYANDFIDLPPFLEYVSREFQTWTAERLLKEFDL